MNLARWQDRLRQFSEERGWKQFHTPKNLAMALSVEASELLEIFQWMSPEESCRVMGSENADAVREEVADVMIYLLRLADVLDLDLEDALIQKANRNETRFPPRGGTG